MPRTHLRWQNYFGRRLVLLTLSLALVSALAGLGEAHWLLDLFSHFHLHYTLLAVLFAVLLVLLGRPRWAMLAGVLALVNGLYLAPYWSMAENSDATGADGGEIVTILQFNVLTSNPRRDEIIRWLEAQAANVDVLVLLEVSEAWKSRLQKLAGVYPNAAWEFLDDNFGIALMTRLKTRSLAVRDIGGYGLPSIVLSANTPKTGQALSLYATHPPPPTSAYLAGIRDAQIAALADEISANHEPLKILLGDLNATAWSAPIKRLKLATGMRDAQSGQGYQGTWPATVLPSPLGIPIDHTLVAGPLRVLSRNTGPNQGSDHYPVITRLAVTEP